MFAIGGITCPTARPDLNGTLWLCDQCGSFISIHSSRVLGELPRPVCGDEMLEFCVAFDSGLGHVFGDA
jgi:hypothetical protein